MLCAIIIGVANLAIITGVANQGKRSNATTAPQAPQAPTQQSQTTTVATPTPRTGDPISDFYGRYGSPNTTNVANTLTWIGSTQIVNVIPDARGKVRQVNILLFQSQPVNQMVAICAQFLPPGADQFSSDAKHIDYHSGLGEIVMQVSDGSCSLKL